MEGTPSVEELAGMAVLAFAGAMLLMNAWRLLKRYVRAHWDGLPDAGPWPLVWIGVNAVASGGLLVWAHRGLGRAIGIVFGLLGTIAGIGLVLSTSSVTLLDFDIVGDMSDDPEAFAFAVFTLLTWLFIFLAMFVGRRHFRRRGVA